MHPRPFRLKLDASLLAGAKWMSMLCLRLTYVSGQTQELIVSRNVLRRRQSHDNHERPWHHWRIQPIIAGQTSNRLHERRTRRSIR